MLGKRRKQKGSITAGAVLVATAALGTYSHAALVAQEQFTGTVGDLNGKTGGTGFSAA